MPEKSTQEVFNQAYLPFLSMEAQTSIPKDNLFEALGALQLAAMDHAKTSADNIESIATVMVRTYDSVTNLSVEPPLTQIEINLLGGTRSAFVTLKELSASQPAPKTPKTTTKTATTNAK